MAIGTEENNPLHKELKLELLGSSHKVSAIWGWMIFGWAMKNSAMTFWAMKNNQMYFMGP